MDFIVPEYPVTVDVPAYELADVSYWISGTQVLVCIVNGGYVDTDGGVTLDLPVDAITIDSTPWSNITWDLASSQLSTASLPALSTSMLILGTVASQIQASHADNRQSVKPTGTTRLSLH